jgi:ankyrin repeat protein
MKLKTWMFALVLAFGAVAHGATNDLTGLLQKGLFEEEANRDLGAAIANYQSLASAFDQDRQLAATAIFRLGECYRKLGKTNEAVIQYQRIIKEFSDQQTLATLSRQNLAGLEVVTPPSSAAATSAAPGNLQSQTLMNLESQYALLNAQLAQASTTTNYGFLIDLFSDAKQPAEQLRLELTMSSANQDMLQKARSRTNDAAIQDAERNFRQWQQDLADLKKQILDYEELRLKSLKSAIEQVRAGQLQSPATAQIENTSTTDDEEKQIRNIQAMIQNSPDLINSAGGGVNGDRTPLMLAAEKGQLIVAKYLLDHGADVNAGSRIGTPLYLAAQNGHKAMVELLLARGADVSHGSSPLYEAVRKGFTGVVDVLLAHKADVNAQNPQFGMRVLHVAVSGGQTNLIQSLIDHGADVNATDMNGKTPLHIAANENKLDAARILIASKADVNASDKEGNTPLHVAAGVGSAKIVSLLLDSGANVDATNQMNVTPLSFAVALGRVDAARALLEHKADPNHSSFTPSGSWPIHSYSSPSQPLVYTASGGGRNEILKLLLDAGANPEADTPAGYSPLDAAIGYNNVEAVQLLLDHGANPNGAVQATESPLNEVFTLGKDTHIVRLLLDKAADPNARSRDGLVPLMRTSDPEVARWLIEHKADVNARIAGGATPLMHAGHAPEEFLKVLLANGAQPDLQDTNGNTALHYAAYDSQTNSVAVLLENRANPNIQNNAGFTPLDLAKKGVTGVRAEAMWAPGLAGFQGVSREAEQQIAAMLVKAGGLANLPKRDRIEVRRASQSGTIYTKGPHDWNNYSLLELIAGNYGLLSQNTSGEWWSGEGLSSTLWNSYLRFPDFKKVVIYRRAGNSVKQTTINVNLEEILNNGDCSRDVPLQWGDIVEVPEADHPVDQSWTGLTDQEASSLIKCVSRQVVVKIKGESTTLKLAPELNVLNNGPIPHGRWQKVCASFMLRSVLDNSKLLRVSSDLSRVKVTRHDPVTKKTVEWIVDCTSPDQANLWLRDGDLIEVPEK